MSINLVLFLILITPSYFVQEKKFFIITITPLLTPLHFALPLSPLLLTPPSPPPNHVPPTRPTHPTCLIPPIPLHGTAHPCHRASHPCPSKSSLPAILASVAALSFLPAFLTSPSCSSPSDPISPTHFLLPPLPPTRPLVLSPSLYPLHHSESSSSASLAPTLSPPFRNPFLLRYTSRTRSSCPHY